MKVNYYPFVCKAIDKPFKDTLDLAVTFATPTSDFIEYLTEFIIANKTRLNDDEIIHLEFIANTGIALITN